MSALLEADGLSVRFSQGRSIAELVGRREPRGVTAVDNVSLKVDAGETLGIVGESGCGKTTLGRALLGLVQRSSGSIRFAGTDLDQHLKQDARAFRRRVQTVFQDPVAALNPKMTVGQTLSEVLRVHNMCAETGLRDRVAGLLDLVGIPYELAGRKPRALSGGQCQRIGIARALAVEPELIVADEAVSALDVSVQAQILNLLAEVQRTRTLALMFISHDLSVVRHVCSRVAVMYLGRIVETGPTHQVFDAPRHPYTRALLAAKLRMTGPGLNDIEVLPGEPPSPLSVPPGCAFHPRCSAAMDKCRTDPAPGLRDDSGVRVACCLYDT